MTEPMYLGDGVYARLVDGPYIRLTTEDGMNVSNEILLEPQVFDALVKFAQRIEWIQNKRPPHIEDPI